MATIDDGFKHATAARGRLFARYPLVVFFLLSFLLTWGYFWVIWAPLRLPDSLLRWVVSGPRFQLFWC